MNGIRNTNRHTNCQENRSLIHFSNKSVGKKKKILWYIKYKYSWKIIFKVLNKIIYMKLKNSTWFSEFARFS